MIGSNKTLVTRESFWPSCADHGWSVECVGRQLLVKPRELTREPGDGLSCFTPVRCRRSTSRRWNIAVFRQWIWWNGRAGYKPENRRSCLERTGQVESPPSHSGVSNSDLQKRSGLNFALSSFFHKFLGNHFSSKTRWHLVDANMTGMIPTKSFSCAQLAKKQFYFIWIMLSENRTQQFNRRFVEPNFTFCGFIECTDSRWF